MIVNNISKEKIEDLCLREKLVGCYDCINVEQGGIIANITVAQSNAISTEATVIENTSTSQKYSTTYTLSYNGETIETGSLIYESAGYGNENCPLNNAFDGVTGSASSGYITPYLQAGEKTSVYMTFENPIKISKMGTGLDRSSMSASDYYITDTYLYGSNDNVNWVSLCTMPYSGVQTKIENPDYYKYYRVEVRRNTTTGSKGVRLYEIVIGEVYLNAEVLGNKFTTPYRVPTLRDGEIIKFRTPANVDKTDVVKNSLNGIEIDTLLNADTLYKLLYKETDNKFYVKEVIEI